MVYNVNIQCDRCKTRYQLRWQVDYSKAAILIRCPQCNSKMKGYLKIIDSGFDKVVSNAAEDKEGMADYIQEISSMFITRKLTPTDNFEDYCTPFIRSDIYNHSNVIQYLQFIEEKPNEAEQVYDLLTAKSKAYLKEKLRDENNIYIAACKSAIKRYKLDSETDLLMAIHQYIMTMLLSSGIDKNVCYLMQEIKELTISHQQQIKDFSKLLDNNGYYKRLNDKFFKLVNLYEENYLSFVPIKTATDFDKINFNEFGVSSVDYEDILEFYNKCYEFVGEFIIYVIGLNNIFERGDFNEFQKGTADIEQKVNQEDKYNRIQSFVKKGEKFSRGFCDTLEKTIRNAEAHFDVTYDVFTQVVKFTNKSKKSTEIEEIYLIQFLDKTIKIFDLCVALWEMAYQLQKNRMISDLRMDWGYGRP